MILANLMAILMKKFQLYMQLVTNKFHVNKCMFSSTSEIELKCGKNKQGAHKIQPNV